MIELRHLYTLHALRDQGSLSRAAERLHLTQSALSHQIKELEDRLKLRLFERKTRPLRFTVAGERMLALADEILPKISETEREFRRLSQGQSGRLHIAVECHSCFDWLMPTLDRYRGYWPQVELDISMGFGFEPLPALARREVDLVITSDPVEDTNIAYLPLFGYQSMILMPRHHRLSARPWVSPQNLSGEVLITYPVDPERLDVFRRFLDPAGITVQRRTSELTVMILQLVASGRGLAALPQWVASHALDSAELIGRPLGEQGLWNTLFAAVRREDVELAYMEAFVETAHRTCLDILADIRAPQETST